MDATCKLIVVLLNQEKKKYSWLVSVSLPGVVKLSQFYLCFRNHLIMRCSGLCCTASIISSFKVSLFAAILPKTKTKNNLLNCN